MGSRGVGAPRGGAARGVLRVRRTLLPRDPFSVRSLYRRNPNVHTHSQQHAPPLLRPPDPPHTTGQVRVRLPRRPPARRLVAPHRQRRLGALVALPPAPLAARRRRGRALGGRRLGDPPAAHAARRGPVHGAAAEPQRLLRVEPQQRGAALLPRVPHARRRRARAAVRLLAAAVGGWGLWM